VGRENAHVPRDNTPHSPHPLYHRISSSSYHSSWARLSGQPIPSMSISLPPFPEIPPVYHRRVLFVALYSLLLGCVAGVVLTRGLSGPAIHAQSAIWQIIAEPETIAGVSLSIVRHTETKHCLVLVQSGTGLTVASDYNATGLCNTPEETEEWKRQRLAFEAELQRSEPDSTASDWRWGPSSVQTTKQPGVPK
jgi:hypothetical protein